MVHRAITGSFPRPLGGGAGWPRRMVGERPWAGLGVDDPRRFAWRAVTAPFWLGSDVPAPLLPARDEPVPAEIGLAGQQVVASLDHLARRLWWQRAAHIVVRGAWLGLVVGCLWLLVERWGGPALDWTVLAIVAAVLALLGIGFAALQRPTRRQVARMLDRSFGLHERMTTAVDHLGQGVPRDGERAPVVYLQMADAANVVAELRGLPALGPRVPVRELVLAIALGLLLAALFFLRGVGGDVPPVQAGAVPVFVPAADRPVEPDPAAEAAAANLSDAPTVDEVRERAQRSAAAQRDLAALGRALADHAVTRSAAEAIQAGDYAEAGDELRELAEDADDLSPASREALAADLDEAASQMSPGSEQLASASREAASGLREGEESAQQGVEQLGEAVAEAGTEVAPQGELAEQMRQAQAAAASGQQQDGGQPSEAGDPAAGSEPSEANEGQQGPPGEGQPGEGAQPGEGSQPGEAGQPGEAAEPGEGQGQAGQEGEGQPGEQAGQPGDGEASQPGAGDASGEGQQSEQGGGAGTGESEGAPENGAPGQTGQPGETGAQGAPAEQRVTEGGGEGADPGDPAAVESTLQLPRAAEGEGVQTSPDGGGSNRGTGAGVTAGSGSAVQGEVGESGPDSNRVPPEYRGLVERYFSEGEGS